MSSISYVGDLVQEFKSFALFAALNYAVMFINLNLLILFIAWLRKNPLNILRLRLLPYFIGFRIISACVVLIISFYRNITYYFIQWQQRTLQFLV